MKNTIVGITKDVHVSWWGVQDDTYAGAILGTHPDSPHVFLWPWSENNVPASRIMVKVRQDIQAATSQKYWSAEAVADIATTSQATGAITVNYGNKGFAKAVARWIRDNTAPFMIEFKDYDGQWRNAETVYGRDDALERLDMLKSDYGQNAYRMARKVR